LASSSFGFSAFFPCNLETLPIRKHLHIYKHRLRDLLLSLAPLCESPWSKFLLSTSKQSCESRGKRRNGAECTYNLDLLESVTSRTKTVRRLEDCSKSTAILLPFMMNDFRWLRSPLV
jgi:hypothetical protein